MTQQSSGGGGTPSGTAGGDLTGTYPSPTLIASRQTAIVQLAKVVASVAAATISFPAISQAYTSLMLDLEGRGDTAAGLVAVGVQLNGDTGANYDLEYLDASVSTASAAQAFGNTSIGSLIILSAATATAGLSGTARLVFPNYVGTVFNKNVHAVTEWKQDNAATLRYRSGVGSWRSSAAISSILLTPTAGNFVTGTTAVLYGLL